MCLISVLPKGTKKNTEEVHEFIKSGFNCNKDGSGFMYKRNGENKITIDKGYFNLTKLIDNITSLNLTEDDELVIHHRIGTAGLVSNENTHPFLISDVESEINAIDITIDKPAMVHNGVFWGITSYTNRNKDFCDSYAFARYFMANKHLMAIFLEDKSLFKELCDRYIGTDKLCLLFPDRDLQMYGHFIENNGYYHSNSGYYTTTRNVGGYEYEEEIENAWNLGIGLMQNCPLPAAQANNRFGEGLPKVITLDQNKVNIHKLVNSKFPINENNFRYFFYKLPGQGEKLYFLENLNLETNMQMFRRKDGAVTVYIPIGTSVLLNDGVVFVPKNPNYSKAIVDYLYLIEKLPDYSKNRLKKTQKIIEDMFMKSVFDEIVYKPLKNLGYQNNKFYKLTLLLYVDYLRDKSKADALSSTDFIEDAVVND